MRKILSSLMVLILLALFATTYFCSGRTEDAFNAQVKQLNLSYPGVLQVELVEYQRGLLVSEVQTRLTLQQRDPLALHHQIRHFPWGITMVTRLAKDSALVTEFAELLPLEQLQLQTDVGLDGASKTSFKLPSLTLDDETGRVQLQGLLLDLALNGQLSGGELNFQLETLQVQNSGEVEIILSGVQLDSQFAEQQELPLGSGELRIEHLTIRSENRPAFELSELRYETSSSLQNERLATELNLTLAGMSLAGESISDGQLQLQLSGIDAAAVRELQKSAQQLQADLLNQQVDPLILQLQMLGLYSQLFTEGLTLTLNRLVLRTEDGALLGKGELMLQEIDRTEASPLAFDQLKGQFQLDIDRSVFVAGFRLFASLQRSGQSPRNPAVAAELAEQFAGGLVQKGILSRREDGGYRIEVSVEHGLGSLNGQPFSF